MRPGAQPLCFSMPECSGQLPLPLSTRDGPSGWWSLMCWAWERAYLYQQYPGTSQAAAPAGIYFRATLPHSPLSPTRAPWIFTSSQAWMPSWIHQQGWYLHRCVTLHFIVSYFILSKLRLESIPSIAGQHAVWMTSQNGRICIKGLNFILFIFYLNHHLT